MSFLRIVVVGLFLIIPFTAFSAQPVDINSADAQTIATTMKGVGLKKAQAIVEYRQKNGNFTSLDELANVKGIGNKTVALNRESITVINNKAIKSAPTKARK